MPVRLVKKTDLPAILNRWINDPELGDVDKLEITAKQDQLIIKRPRRRSLPSRSAVLATKGTMHLPAKTVHEIALSREILYDS